MLLKTVKILLKVELILISITDPKKTGWPEFNHKSNLFSSKQIALKRKHHSLHIHHNLKADTKEIMVFKE